MQIYRDQNYWDCVATCFFIDCSNNIIDFVEIIYNILKPGGIWINLGPLLYHFSDVLTEHSIEPTYEDLIVIIQSCGFIVLVDIVLLAFLLVFLIYLFFQKNKTDVTTTYSQNPTSMHQCMYKSIYLVCQKPEQD